jgi:hypothetical protein
MASQLMAQVAARSVGTGWGANPVSVAQPGAQAWLGAQGGFGFVIDAAGRGFAGPLGTGMVQFVNGTPTLVDWSQWAQKF